MIFFTLSHCDTIMVLHVFNNRHSWVFQDWKIGIMIMDFYILMVFALSIASSQLVGR